MFCGHCGNKMEDSATFCPNCGASVGTENAAVAQNMAGAAMSAQQGGVPSQPYGAPVGAPAVNNVYGGQPVQPAVAPAPTKKMGKVKKALLTILFVIVAVVGAAVYWYSNSSIKEMQTLLADEEYTKAIVLYNGDIQDMWLEKTVGHQLLSFKVKSTYSAFDEDKITYEDACIIYMAFAMAEDEALAELVEEHTTLLDARYLTKAALAEGAKQFEKGNYFDAISAYQQVAETAPEYEETLQKIEEAKELYKAQVLEQAEGAQTTADYEEFIPLVADALTVLPNDADLTSIKQDLEMAYAEDLKASTSKRVGEFVQAHDYPSALAQIHETIGFIGEDSTLTALLESTENGYVAYLEQQVQANGLNFEPSLKAIEEAVKLLPDNQGLLTLQQTTQDSFVSSIRTNVETMIASKKYSEAAALATQASDLLPDNAALTQLLAELEASKPVNLCDLTIAEQDHVEQLTEREIIKDTAGNIYDIGNLYAFKPYNYGAKEAYLKVYLGGQYTSLSFTLAVNMEPDATGAASLIVFGDGDRQLYCKEYMNRTTAPTLVDVDVTGVEWLYISVQPDQSDCINLLISNPQLYK